MSAAIPQQPGVPVVANPYGQPAQARRYGVTAEQLRAFGGKEAGEEDFRHFLVSDTMNLSYEKTKREWVYMQNTQQRYPSRMTFTVPKSSYPYRMDTGYFFFAFNLDVEFTRVVEETGDEGKQYADPVQPSLSDVKCLSNKFLKLLKQVTITMGSNKATLTFPESDLNYQNRVMYYMQRPISASNRTQEYAMADMLMDFRIMENREDGEKTTFDSDRSRLLWAVMNVNPSKYAADPSTAKTNYRIPLQFVVPLTLLHPVFNFDSVVCPGLDLSFDFEFLYGSEAANACFVKGGANPENIAMRVRSAPHLCRLSLEQPYQYSEVLTNLKFRTYLYDVLLPQYYRTQLAKPKSAGTFLSNVYFKLPKSPMPVRLDFLLVESKNIRQNPRAFRDACVKYLEYVEFKVTLPFPFTKRIYFDNLGSTGNFSKDYTVAEGLYQSMGAFTTADYAHQRVESGTYPPVSLMYPLNPIAYHGPLLSSKLNDDDYFADLKTLSETAPHSVILQPSGIFNQNPFPEVRGTLAVDFKFKEQYKDADLQFELFVNFYNYFRVEVKNGKVLILALDDLGVALSA